MKKDGDGSRRPSTALIVARLGRCEKERERIRKGSCSSGAFLLWRKQTEETLKALYGDESAEVREFTSIYYTPVFLTCRMGDDAFDEAYRNGLDEAGRLLQACLKRFRPPG